MAMMAKVESSRGRNSSGAETPNWMRSDQKSNRQQNLQVVRCGDQGGPRDFCDWSLQIDLFIKRPTFKNQTLRWIGRMYIAVCHRQVYREGVNMHIKVCNLLKNMMDRRLQV